MTSGGRRALALTFGAATVAAKVAASVPRVAASPAAVGITWLVVLSFVVTGLVLLRTIVPPANGWACLWVAAATVPGDVNNAAFAGSRLTPVGYVLDPMYLPLAVALVLRYPRARLSPSQRALVVILAAWTSTARALTAITAGRLDDGFRRPRSWPTVPASRFWHDTVFLRGGHLGTLLLLLVAAALIVRRSTTAGGLARKAMTPLAVIGIACALSAAADQAVWVLNLTGLHVPWPALLRDLSAAAIPAALLADLLRRRMAAAAISERVLDAARQGSAPELQRVLRQVLVDDSLTVLVATEHGWVDATDRPARIDDPPGRSTHVVGLDEGQPLVAVGFDTHAVDDDPILATALSAVRMGAENLRLTADLRARVTELEHSRERIVEAALAERRRVERDLHDGAQQKFLAVAATLARADLVTDDQVRAVVGDARGSLRLALRELRELARGIHPAALSQGGLPAALAGLPTVEGAVVRLEVDPELAVRRPPAAQESAVFFLVAESLTNAMRYSGAGAVSVRVRRDLTGRLTALVADDGAGGARVVPGGGLAGLLDRVEALGGEFAVHADPCPRHPDRSGTAVRAEFPAAQEGAR